MTEQYAIAEQAGQLALANKVANDLHGVIHSVTNQDMKAFWAAMEEVAESLIAAGMDREQLVSGLMAKTLRKEHIEELNGHGSCARRAI